MRSNGDGCVSVPRDAADEGSSDWPRAWRAVVWPEQGLSGDAIAPAYRPWLAVARGRAEGGAALRDEGWLSFYRGLAPRLASLYTGGATLEDALGAEGLSRLEACRRDARAAMAAGVEAALGAHAGVSGARILEVGWDDASVWTAARRALSGAPCAYHASVPTALHAARVRRQHPAIEWIVLDPMSALSCQRLAGQGFDLVVTCMSAFGHRSRARLLEHLAMLVRPDGRLIVCEPGPSFGPAEPLLALAAPPALPDPDPLLSREAWSSLAAAHGFRLAEQADAPGGARWYALIRREAREERARGGADDPFPLTDIQHAYWIGRGDDLALGGVSCHVYFEWRVRDLDLPRFEAAWNRVVQRHGMMRAHVTPDGRQRILPEVPHCSIVAEDLRDLPPERASARLAEKREAMCGQVLDAGRWPLFDLRASLERGGATRLHLDLDLLMFDVQSFHILLAELDQLYREPARTLPPIAVSFRDYVLAEAREAASPARAEDRAWWLERLSSIAPPPDLPLARAPQEVTRPRFRRLSRRLPIEAWERLSSSAGELGLTGSSVLLAAFSEVLARWSADARFTLNLTHFNRRRVHPHVDRLVGDFTSVLLLTVDCGAPQTFAERALSIQGLLWSCLARTRFGGIEVLRELARSGALAGDALMPIVFTSLLGMDLDPLVRGADLLGEPDHLYTCTPQVWLDHQVMVRKGTLEYNWIAIDDLFPPGLVDAMFEAYGGLLDWLAADVSHWRAPVPDLLPPSQRAARSAANATARLFSLEPLHAGFLRQALSRPEALACATAREQASYGELLGRALAVAGALRGAGLGPGAPVVVALPKGVEQIAAALGVLAAGLVLVPVAADAPRARLSEILAHSEARALVAREDLGQGAVPHIDPAQLPPAPATPERVGAALGPSSLDALAYVIYTSGSTGKPKGVAIRHAAAANTLADINGRVGLTAEDRVLGISSLSFDLAIYDVFAALSAGAALILPDEEGARDAPHWLDLMHRHGVTVWNSVPALLGILVEYAEATGAALPDSLRWALLSGDWIPLDLPDRVRRKAPRVRVAALGGATEAAIWSNWLEVEDVPPEWRSVPYGFPLANQGYRILDARLRDRPDFVTGALHISGAGLAEGYWRDPERTAESFFVHPDTGERLYRTGDLARYWADGCIEFLGRADTQVKLGGHRIELGEIEASLAQVPGVGAAAVTVWQAPGGAKQLCAYVVPASDARATDAGWPQIVAAARRAAAALPPAEAVAALRRFQDETEALSPSLILRNLHALGFDLRRGATFRLADEAARCGVAPRYHRLLRAWLAALEEAGDVARQGERYTVARQPPPLGELEARIAAARASIEANLGWVHEPRAFAAWLFESAALLPSVLRGRSEAVALLFPEGESRSPETLYQRNIVADYLGEIAAAALVGAARRGSGGFRALEVGAGVGGLTASTLPALAEACAGAEYHYTDVSPFFGEIGSAKFGRYPGLRLGRYDINRAAAEQGYEAASFGAILAANVLHNAHDLAATLAELHDLLQPGGVLICLEATRNKRLQLVTAAAVLEHAAAGGERRDDALPLLDEAAWRAALGAAGFDAPAVLPAADAPLGFVGQQLFVAARRALPAAVAPSSLRQRLSERLPRYMVPERFVYLDALPLSANGKVDRKRLPAPVTPVASEEPHDPPRPGLETQLAERWAELLRVGRVGRASDFFALGGDSLLATRLAARLTAELGRSVPVRLLFEHRRLAEQAEALARAVQGGAWSPVVRLSPGAPRALICVHASDGFGAAYRPLAERLGVAASCVALQAFGLEEGQSPALDIDGMAARYIDALRAAGERGPWRLAGWSMGAYVAAEMARQLAAKGEAVALLALIDPAPQAALAPSARSERALFGSLAPARLCEALAERCPSDDGFAALPAAERLSYWRAALQENPLARQADDGALARMVAVLWRNVAAMVNHRLGPLPRQATVFYRAASHPAAWGDTLAPWLPVLPGGARCVSIASTHWDIVSSQALADDLRSALEST
ncbi:amino acid adenylation domain-containing protein [Sorangium sp. So ce861]|uniref:amino acid adenylation domain-containing protein n=1 Tax=Sorangium sp. So ce861 TaxID=3133323 RepID=UPI003F63B364